MCLGKHFLWFISNIPEVADGVERVDGGLVDGDDGGIPHRLHRLRIILLDLHHLRHQRRFAAAGAAGDGEVEDELAVAGQGAACPRVQGAALQAGLGEDLHPDGGPEEGGRGEEEEHGVVSGPGRRGTGTGTRSHRRLPSRWRRASGAGWG